MNDIKARIKSVQSTMQITKAMELVATSKLRRAKEKVERARPYYETLAAAIRELEGSADVLTSVYNDAKREVKKTLYVVIAGDRGLAGGYNSNIFRLTAALCESGESIILPVGKKALEHYRARGAEIFTDSLTAVAEVSVGDCFDAGELIVKEFLEGKIDKVVLVYTKFVSMMTQTPVYEELIPFTDGLPEGEDLGIEPLIEEEAEEMLNKIVPQYVGGVIWSALCEAAASESGARRSAMNAANKNASEMIDTLMLKYNRARQAVITQEITEIVSGAEAL